MEASKMERSKMPHTLDMFTLQRPQLPRDSRGSLEVFQPSSHRSRSDNSPGSSAPELQSRADSHLGAPRKQVFPDAGPRRSIEATLDLETGPRFPSKLRPGTGRKSPVSFRDLQTIKQENAWKQSEEQSQRLGGAGKSKLLSEHVAADRAAEWGLVLKAEVGTGKIQGVGVRKNSGESTSSCVRTSEDSAHEEPLNAERIPRVSEDLKDALSSFQQTFVVCDAGGDFPILYASAGFFSMTGYTPSEVIGRNCRFLQGADTDPSDVSKIRLALEQGRSFCGRLLNYKKNGAPFWNLLTIAPIKDEDGKILKYIGMLVEVSQFTEGTKDKALRPNGMPESLIKYDARQKDNVASSVTELVEAFKKPVVKSPLKAEEPDGRRASAGALTQVPEAGPMSTSKKTRRSSSLLSLLRPGPRTSDEPGTPQKTSDDFPSFPDIMEELTRKKESRRGIDLATTLERIEKNFVITDPRLPDNPIIFASDSFLELTEYSREEILGKNCRFLQGPDTNQETVQQIRDAISQQRSITVQLLNYTKRGKPFWNLFHLQPMRDNKGELQYFIGVQLDGSQHFDKVRKGLPDNIEHDGSQVIQTAAGNVDTAVRELPDANQNIHDLWYKYTKRVVAKPHKFHTQSWRMIEKVLKTDGRLSLKHFRPVKSLGSGDTGGVHLVELRDTGHFFAMKAMDKASMLNRNKVHRTLMEREILDMMDHPFLPTLYGSFETEAHVCLITDFCPGGELFNLLDAQPSKTFHEDAVCFYAAEVVVALEYLHCKGVIYRDLKPENILIQSNGHLLLTDFDLSFLTSSRAELVTTIQQKHGKKKSKQSPSPPTFVAEPATRSNSFVGTEEYIAPEVINGSGHSSAVDWWALGILLYEMLFGWTPFRAKSRQKTFRNIVKKEVVFPSSVPVSLAAKELIQALLQKDPGSRLGSVTGANELKQHPFFHKIYWPLIRCKTCPRLDSPVVLTDEFCSKEQQNTTEMFSVF